MCIYVVSYLLMCWRPDPWQEKSVAVKAAEAVAAAVAAAMPAPAPAAAAPSMPQMAPPVAAAFVGTSVAWQWRGARVPGCPGGGSLASAIGTEWKWECVQRVQVLGNKLGGSPTLGILDLVEPPWISLVVPTNAKDICRSRTTRGTSVRHGPAPACWLCILHPEGLREKTQRVNSRDPLVGYNLQDVTRLETCKLLILHNPAEGRLCWLPLH